MIYICSVKRILPILLCFCIAVLAFENALVFFSFTIHQDQLTESYCIDKYSTDQVMCSGRCVLEVQLSANEDQSSEHQQMVQSQKISSVSYVVPTSSMTLMNPDEESSILSFAVPVFEGQPHLSALFRPPIA